MTLLYCVGNPIFSRSTYSCFPETCFLLARAMCIHIVIPVASDQSPFLLYASCFREISHTCECMSRHLPHGLAVPVFVRDPLPFVHVTARRALTTHIWVSPHTDVCMPNAQEACLNSKSHIHRHIVQHAFTHACAKGIRIRAGPRFQCFFSC